MQHHHRNRHRLFWVILAPLALVLLILAVLNRPDWPEMESLPGTGEASDSKN